MTEDFEIKIVDLGCGIALHGRQYDGFNQTRLGTQLYMAPEIELNLNYQGTDADCFAFGASLLVAKVMEYPFKKASLT